jgi:hypothetical protein
VDTHNAVGNRNYGADVARFCRCLEVLDAFFNQLADFISFSSLLGQCIGKAFEPCAQ